MPERSQWIQFLAHYLFFLAAWTLFIKYLFPVAYALAYGESWSSHIYWDAWPIAHLWLGWALLARPRYTWALALAMSAMEIGIIASKFAWFLADPEWDIWRVNWFVNKVFVLMGFILVLLSAVIKPSLFRKFDSLQSGEKN